MAYTTANTEEFVEGLAEHRPDTIFGPDGAHPVEYVETDEGTVARVAQALPEGVTVELDDGPIDTQALAPGGG